MPFAFQLTHTRRYSIFDFPLYGRGWRQRPLLKYEKTNSPSIIRIADDVLHRGA